MSYRLATLGLALLGVLTTSSACGTAATGDSAFDGGHVDSGHVIHEEDAKLNTPDTAPHKLQSSDGSSTGSCTPKTCADLGVSCGEQGDGCGNLLACGTCTAPETCGGGGVPNACGAHNADAGDANAIPTGPLTIAPLNKVITVAYGTVSAAATYTAQVGGQSVSASFAIDLGQVAKIDPSTGVLTPSGTIGGVAHVTASFGGQTVTTPVTVALTLTQNGAGAVPDAGADASPNAGGNAGVGGSPAGGPVSMATETLLQNATGADGGVATDSSLVWLYPYDKTVWPQGVLAPLLQWTTAKTYDGVAIKLAETAFTYQGFFATPAAGKPFINVPIPQAAWDTLVYSNQGDPVTVTLVFSSGAVAYGPLTETWTIAQGTLTGTVYYQSYGTSLVVNYPGSNGYPNFGAATLAIKHGATSPVVVAGTGGVEPGNTNCRVCHAVSAGGGTLITEHGNDYNETSAYNLGAGNAETVMDVSASVATFAFPAISPDGTFLFSNTGPIPGINPPITSGLFGIPSGAAIASTGLPMGLSAALPVFSPDGTHLAFNDYGLDKKSLASIDFAAATKTFANLQTLDTPASGSDLYPAFLPTNDAVVFERETVVGGNGSEFAVTRDQARGALYWVDLNTHKVAELATLNGTGYLPTYGTNHASDDTLQYEPTINPVPSGGYAWVVFTSRRAYGNVATQDPFLSDPRNYNATLSATTKKLWVAAIDLNATPGTDPSHPAFYLPAQEILAGNSRGYWVVDPCEATGVSCETGDQCCTGYCGATADAGLACGTQPPGCAVLGNKCVESSDCCGASTGISCIDGYCAEPGRSQDAGSCAPTTCAKLGIRCGPAGDGCGGLLECGTCTNPETCGGGGTSGVCGGTKGPP